MLPIRSFGPVSLTVVVMITLILLPDLPLSIAEDIEDQNSGRSTRTFSIHVHSDLDIGPDGLPWLNDVHLDIDDDLLDWGFTSGDGHQVLLDPTPDAPMLPWISTVVRIKGEIIGSIVTVRSDLFAVDKMIISTMPAPRNPWESEDRMGIWTDDDDLPEERLQWSSPGYARVDGELHKVFTIYFLPFMRSDDGQLVHIGSSRIEIEIEELSSFSLTTRSDGDPADVPGTLSVTEHLDIPPEYLIITGSDLVEELQVLADWRNDMGIPASVINVEDILESYEGEGDDADKIRDYIRDVLDGWGRLRNVLLAGDWQTIPVKSIHDSHSYDSWDDGTIPADSFFQCLDGTWDLDGDGLVGEPGDIEDAIPDLVVSRLAIDDPDIWEGKIQQIKDYELMEGRREWSEKAMLIGANTHNEGDGSIHSEYLWDKYLDRTFSEKMPLYEDEGTLTRSGVDSGLEEGVSFVQFVDHGGPTVWCDDYGAGVVYSDRDARDLMNAERLPFISTLACLTTWFDDTSGCKAQRFSESLGEAFTENTNGGAMAYVGSSRTSVGILGVERYLPYDNGLQEDIARQVGGQSVYSAGSVHTLAKTHYAESWSREFENPGNAEVSLCWLEFTLLGEPLTEIWTSEARELNLVVDHEDDLDPYIIIRVADDADNPEPDVNVTLQNFERGVFERGITDENGVVEFELELDWFCDINLTASKHDHLLYKDYISISDIIAPETELLTDPELPDGDNGWFVTMPEIRLVPNEKAKVHYSFGSSIYQILNGSGNYTLEPLREGSHDLHFFSEDIAGNIEMERKERIMIDLFDPNVTISIVPDGPNGLDNWYTTEPQVTLHPIDQGSGSPIILMYKFKGEDWMVYDHPFFIPEGEHTLEYKAVDRSGRSSAIGSQVLRIDTSPPDTRLSIRDAGEMTETGWYIRSPDLELISSEMGSRIEYRLDPTQEFQSYNGPFGVADGIHDLQYRSIDPSGNLGPTISSVLKVDTSSPIVVVDCSPGWADGENGFFSSTPTVDLRCVDNIQGELRTRLDEGEWTTGRSRYIIDDGEHTLEFYGIDPAGNKCPVQTMDFKVDTSAPISSIEITGSRNDGWFTSRPLVHLSSDEYATVHYSWDRSESPQIYDGPINPPKREGSFKLQYWSVDAAGNIESEKEELIRCDSVEPVLRTEILRSGSSGFLIDCSGTSDGTELEYRILEGSRTIVDWTSDDLIPISLDAGERTLTIEVRDQGGNIDTVEIDVKVESRLISMLKVLGPISIVIVVTLCIFAMVLHNRKNRKYDDIIDQQERSDHGHTYQAMVIDD